MDQVPYPGPGVLFHVRMVILFTILATVDVVALGVAMNTILTEGVGGTVLFANEVSLLCIQSPPVVDQPLVRNPAGQRLEFYRQVLHQHHRVPPRACEWWRHGTSMGKQINVPILYRTLHWYVCTVPDLEISCLPPHRFHEAHNLPSVLLADNCEARPSSEHDSRRVHHRSLVRHTISRTHSIPLRYTGYGSSLSQCHGG